MLLFSVTGLLKKWVCPVNFVGARTCPVNHDTDSAVLPLKQEPLGKIVEPHPSIGFCGLDNSESNLLLSLKN